MSNWEDKYNKYKDGGIDNELNKIVDRADTGKLEDYADYDHKEYDKLIKVKKNMPQVENVVEYIGKLKNELNKLKTELETRKTLVEASKKIEKLGKEIDKLQEQSEKIAKQLRDPKLSDDKRAELQAEQDKIGPEMAKRQDSIQENENILNSGLGSKRELQNLSEEDIRKQIESKNNEITKCNFVANMLVNGNDWDRIEEKLDNWQDKKFTSKDGKLKGKIENKLEEKAENKVEEKTEEKAEKNGRQEKVNKFMEEYNPDFSGYEDEPEEYKPTFAERHPKIAKIRDFFKNMVKMDRFKKIEKPEGMKLEEGKSEEGKLEEGKLEEGKTTEEAKAFKEYIRRIAEKGMDGVAAEEKAARQAAAKEKLAEMRKGNRATEAEKFGEDYAKGSDYRDDDGR